MTKDACNIEKGQLFQNVIPGCVQETVSTQSAEFSGIAEEFVDATEDQWGNTDEEAVMMAGVRFQGLLKTIVTNMLPSVFADYDTQISSLNCNFGDIEDHRIDLANSLESALVKKQVPVKKGAVDTSVNAAISVLEQSCRDEQNASTRIRRLKARSLARETLPHLQEYFDTKVSKVLSARGHDPRSFLNRDDVASTVDGRDQNFPLTLSILQEEMAGEEYRLASALFGYDRESGQHTDHWMQGIEKIFNEYHGLVTAFSGIDMGILSIAFALGEGAPLILGAKDLLLTFGAGAGGFGVGMLGNFLVYLGIRTATDVDESMRSKLDLPQVIY